MENYFLQKLSNVKNSFIFANRGEENVNFLIWIWGVPSYIISYFIINKAILAVNFLWFDYLASILISIFYIWHIYVVKKCAPKKPKLTKEEKKQLRIKNRATFAKRFTRKLLLQEPWMKSNPVTTAIIVDLFCIAHFLAYIF